MSRHILGLFAALLAGGAQAATFLTISDVGTNMGSGNPGGNPLTNVIQGAGIGFDAAEPHNRIGGVWYTDAPGGFPSDYINVRTGSEYLWFDLGTDVTLTEMSYWGYSTGNANGMREFNIRFATDAEGGALGLGDEAYGSSISLNPSFVALQDTLPRQSFSFDPVSARYVQVEATSTFFNQPGAGAGGDRLGIGEIAFEAIPEPSSVFLAFLGVALLARRKR